MLMIALEAENICFARMPEVDIHFGKRPIYIYIYIYVHRCTYIYIYIYRERERETIALAFGIISPKQMHWASALPSKRKS